MKLDEYTLTQFLGKGTFGEVYLTRKDGSNNLYATKRMDRTMVDNPRYKKYFNNEISILKILSNNNNIIHLEKKKETVHNYYLIMEYCNGGSLQQCLRRYKESYHQPFTEEIVQHLMRQIVGAVKHIHSNGIIHRDLKLDNILVNFQNRKDYDDVNLLKAQIKIIDFGFASSKDDPEWNKTAIGSPLNMDPLILKKFNSGRAETKDSYYDEKADIWSLGALCYQMLIGHSPFDAYNMQELAEKVEEGTYSVPTNLSREVVSFLNGMLQYDPKRRLNAEELSKHAFLTKNYTQFQHINTNLISRKVSGGQLNINIKNNQSIWAIFNEKDQETLNNIPGQFYSDTPISELSESRYLPNPDNVYGIAPKPYGAKNLSLGGDFEPTKSVPISDLNSTQQSETNPSYNSNGGMYSPVTPAKNIQGQMPNYPGNQKNIYPQQNMNLVRTPQMMNNNMNNNTNPNSNIVTIKNGDFFNEENIPIQNKNQQPPIYNFGRANSNNNIPPNIQIPNPLNPRQNQIQPPYGNFKPPQNVVNPMKQNEQVGRNPPGMKFTGNPPTQSPQPRPPQPQIYPPQPLIRPPQPQIYPPQQLTSPPQPQIYRPQQLIRPPQPQNGFPQQQLSPPQQIAPIQNNIAIDKGINRINRSPVKPPLYKIKTNNQNNQRPSNLISNQKNQQINPYPPGVAPHTGNIPYMAPPQQGNLNMADQHKPIATPIKTTKINGQRKNTNEISPKMQFQNQTPQLQRVVSATNLFSQNKLNDPQFNTQQEGRNYMVPKTTGKSNNNKVVQTRSQNGIVRNIQYGNLPQNQQNTMTVRNQPNPVYH
jgi:serine/threonine protein kinase